MPQPMSSRLAEAAARAEAAQRSGDAAGAAALLRQSLANEPAHPAALNQLGLALIAAEQPGEAAAALRQAVAADPAAGALRINLADALRLAGDDAGERAVLEEALAADPYLLPALLRKAQALERTGQHGEAVRAYRALLATTPDASGLPTPIAEALNHGRALLREDAAARRARLEAPLAAIRSAEDAAALARAEAYVESLCGSRRVYVQQPTGPHFPFLPAFEYFDRALFPWFGELEAAVPAIREELVAL